MLRKGLLISTGIRGIWRGRRGAHLLGTLTDEGGLDRYVKEGSGNGQISP
jgi:hypothetical protein